ncbi:terminase large subunit domain-containing protein [Nocardioides sp. Leaf307]|uniref:terminase large subunit domain-containing protein n=1 Tax=Nocardioides sp. Leaf307 TaxID=1736331 RepID=UPI000AE9A3F0|nr:terminase large subunit [Nocardioides sp. Leaf307]
MTERWIPGTYTSPLSPDFVSDGPVLRKFVELFCKTEDGNPLVLDAWQAWLVDHVLERYPDDWHEEDKRGRLRYRSVVISMGRQNGKSELAQVFGFYGLMMHEAGPYVLSLASNADQATIIYNRVKYSIDSNRHLNNRFKTTGTRGITRLDKPGTYKVKPAKADALQGIPVTLCLFDEVHLCPPDMWSAMILGTTAKKDGLVIGITTAGDDNSTLLKTLYDQGKQSVAGTGSQRLGFFVWEAPEGCKVDDPEALMDANPALASGRLSMDVALEQVRSMQEADARRFRLNQFVSSESSWLPMSMWHRAEEGPVPIESPVFTVDRTVNWEYATITATVKTDEGVHTGVVASIRKPNLEWLVSVCEQLQRHNPSMFVMDGYSLGDLGNELNMRGMPTKIMRKADVTNACATAYALIATGKVKHAGDPLLAQQLPFAVRKNDGAGYRVNKGSSSSHIDAVMATIFGIYVAANQSEQVLQLF